MTTQPTTGGTIGTPTLINSSADLLVSKDTLDSFLGTGRYSDAVLLQIAAWASAAVESYCGQKLALSTGSEWIDVADGISATISRSPLIRVLRLCSGTVASLRISANDCTTAQASVTDGVLTVTAVTSAGTDYSEITLSEHRTMASLAAAISALPNFTASVMIEADPKSLYPSSTFELANVQDYLYSPAFPMSPRIVRRSGVIGLPGLYCGPLYVEYQAGYATIPADLELTICQIASEILKSKSLSKQLKSEQLGDYKYETNTDVIGIVQTYAAQLSPYKLMSL